MADISSDLQRDREYNRRTWLSSVGISVQATHEMGLDRWELDDLAWQVLANEALRQRARHHSRQPGYKFKGG